MNFEHLPDSVTKIQKSNLKSMQHDYQHEDEYQHQIVSPTSIKDLNTDFENHSKNQAWPSMEQDLANRSSKPQGTNQYNSNQAAYLSTSSKSIEQNENSLYLNKIKGRNQNASSPPPPSTVVRASNLVTSPSQTFGTSFQPLSNSKFNRSVPNTSFNNVTSACTSSTTRPEKLFHQVT